MVETPRKKLAVLISGRGSNMEAILEATREQGYPAEIAIVISDNIEAKGLETARNADIKAIGLPRADYSTRAEHETAVIASIENADADIICLAGYMRILSKEFCKKFEDRLINIHPSLLPTYKGLDTHARALEDGVKIHGCTVHYVNAEMDGGEIIAQAAVPVLDGDDEKTLAARVLKAEHILYSKVIQLISSGNIKLESNKVKFNNVLELSDQNSLFSIDVTDA